MVTELIRAVNYFLGNCQKPIKLEIHILAVAGADPGFLERGFICMKVWGFTLLIIFHFLKYPMKMK